MKALVLLILILGLMLSACQSGNQSQLTPTSQQTSIPTNTAELLPDLVITDINLELDSDNMCAPLTSAYPVRVVIRNQGTGTSPPFDVRVNNEQQKVTQPLPTNETEVLHFLVSDLNVNVWVDEIEAVEESDETNNFITRQIHLPSPLAVCIQTPTPIVAIQSSEYTLSGHTASVLSVAFSPDGNILASGSVDNTLRLWRVDEAQLLRTMYGHPFPVLTLAFSPDGAYLATGSTDGAIRLWQVSDGRLLRTLQGHGGWINGLAYSPSGAIIMSCGEDFTVRLWRAFDGQLTDTIDEGMAAITEVTFSPDGQTIAWSEANGTIRLRSLNGSWIHVMKTEDLEATSIAFSPRGEWLTAGYSDGTIRVWNVENGNLLQMLGSHTGSINSIAFSPDHRWLISGSKDGTLRLWRILNSSIQSKPVLVFFGHSGAVNSVAISPLSKQAASGSEDTTIRLWILPEE